MKRWMSGIYSVIALMVFARPAASQIVQDTTPRDTTDGRPFVEGDAFDKPTFTRLLGRIVIGGYAEAHARWEQEEGVTDEAGFELRRWAFFTASQVNDFIRTGAEVEFEEGGEEIELEYAIIDFTIHPSFTLRAGAILSPLGRFNISHDPPKYEFTDRPLVSTEIIGVALSEPGLGALGQFGLGGTGRLTYEMYAVNGFHDGLINDSPNGTRLPMGRGNIEDNNASPAFVGRVAWSPRLGYELGMSGHRGAYNSFLQEGEEVEERNNLTIWMLDLEATVAGVKLSGEAATVSVDIPPGLQSVYASNQRGAYVQAVHPFGRGWVRTIPRSFFEVGALFDVVDYDADLTGDLAQRFTLGLNFRPTPDAVLKLNYVRGRTRDRFNNLDENAGFLFSMTTYF